jgi:hypothetical protein
MRPVGRTPDGILAMRRSPNDRSIQGNVIDGERSVLGKAQQ